MIDRLHPVLRNITRGWILPLGLVLLGATTFRSAVADWNDVPSGSMKPTILIGDRIFVNKLAYDLKVPFTRTRVATWGHPERGDIVICWSPADGKRLVKRVVGLPGDTVALQEGRLSINGRELSYAAADQEAVDQALGAEARGKVFLTEDLTGRRHTVAFSPEVAAIRNFGPLVLPDGKYFMMGDNRDRSGDSRIFGFVDRSAIAGEATAVAISLNYENHYLPRWSRFFSKLQ